MDTDIRKTNRIPGCDQLTRPEEIAALSKYLGEIKRVQEEHTKLEDRVPGINTGKIPEIEELENTIIPGTTNPKQTKELENTRIKVGGDKEEVKLEENKEKLHVGGNITLETQREELEDRRDIKLENQTKLLNVDGENNLSENVERINDRREIELQKQTEKLNTPDNPLLSDYTEKLEKENTEPNLTDYILGLGDTDPVSSLVDSIITPQSSPSDIDSLGNIRKDIDPEEISSLRGNIEGLDIENEINNLPDNKEELEGIEGREDLGTTRDDTTLEPVNPDLSTNASDYLRGVIEEANRRRDEDGLYNTAIHLFTEEDSEWGDRVASLMSSYLSSSRISPDRAAEFEDLLAASFIYPGSAIQQTRPENVEGVRGKAGKQYEDPDVVKENAYLIKPTLLRPEDGSTGPNEGEAYYIERDSDGNPRRRLRFKDEDGNKAPSYANEDEKRLYEKKDIENNKIQYIDGKVRTPGYKLETGTNVIDQLRNVAIGALNRGGASNYLRYIAEQTVGFGDWTRGSVRAQLINEALALLILERDAIEKTARINRDRLPGDGNNAEEIIARGISGGLSRALGGYGYKGFDPKAGVQDIIRAGIDIGKNILGRTTSKQSGYKNYSDGGKYEDYKSPVPDTPFNRPTKLENGESETRMVYGYGYNSKVFNQTYIYNPEDKFYTGLGITLRDLCGKSGEEGTIYSLEDLKKILENGELMTTSGKVNKGIQRTLDSNMYWEVVLSPYCSNGGEASNGGYSYLPSIKEINTINRVENGVETRYNKWIPISGFELQKSKLTTKSLGLFDGEINYPVTSEYTNELRITVVDDQWKSWKHYFQKCADVSVYNSEQHKSDYYDIPNPLPTAVDKSTMVAAFYKNITFLVSIYIMTPQYATLRKFSLLCVLRDFSEEYTGEVDSAGSDLTVSFSIVGEIYKNDDNLLAAGLDNNRPTINSSDLKIIPEPFKPDPPKERKENISADSGAMWNEYTKNREKAIIGD